jgi:hypothetical protein
MGMPAKGKDESVSDKIMSAAKMKPLLALSKKEPVQAAIGLTADGDGVVLLDKKMKPKKVMSVLKAMAAKEKIQLQPSTLRFGKAEVDTDYDPGMVRFFVNKEAPGNMRPKLIAVFKQIAYSKVEFNIDTALEDEPEEEGEGEDAGAPTTATTTDAQPSAPPAPPPIAPAPPPMQAKAPPDANALRTALGQLTLAIPTVAKGDATLQDALTRLAALADGSLKGGDLEKAATEIDNLRRALAAAMEQAKLTAKAEGGGGAVTYAKSRLAWLAARKKIESDIETLRQRIIDAFKDQPIAPQLDTSYRTKVAPVLAALDESLADVLDDATNETDAAKRTKLVADAKGIMAKYAQFLTSEPLIKDLDENPFLPLSIRATVGGTISTLSKAIH